ncbi:MAG: magnesium transporter, partial [Clostridia bacterium]|nr:magnesium transporter [Clostridia bacterium]
MEEKEFEVLENLLEDKRFCELHDKFLDMNSVDIAEFLGEIDNDYLLRAFRILPKDISAEVFSYLDTEEAEHIVRSITDKELCRLVDDMFIDDTVDFLEEVPANVVNRVLKVANAETRNTINRYLNYAEDTAGSIMTNEMVQLHTYYTAKQAIESIRSTATDKETIYTCYCVDDSRKLVGIVELKDLLLCEEETLVSEIMDEKNQIISVMTSDDQEDVADLARKYDLLSVPVTDKEGRLVGIITIDDIVDIIEKENTEDFEKMAAMRPADESYLKTGVFKLAKNRILWLAILMISATFTGNLMRNKEALLAEFVFLVTAMPMLMNTSGNA